MNAQMMLQLWEYRIGVLAIQYVLDSGVSNIIRNDSPHVGRHGGRAWRACDNCNMVVLSVAIRVVLFMVVLCVL